MTSSRKNNWDEVMEDVNKAIPTNNHGLKGSSGIILDPPESPTVGNALENIEPSIYTRIGANLDRVKNMLNGEKAEESRIMFQNISKRWFDCDDAEVDVAIMMAELKIERIKYDHSKEDSYLDAIAYLTMALAFMQEREKDDQR